MTPAPPGNGIQRGVSRPSTFLASRFLASLFGSRARSGGSGRVVEVGEARDSGSMLLANSKIESAFLRACNYITLVPQRLSSATMANLHTKYF